LCECVKEKEKKTTGVGLKVTVKNGQILRNAKTTSGPKSLHAIHAVRPYIQYSDTPCPSLPPVCPM